MKKILKKIGSAFTKNKVLEEKKNKINKPETLDQKIIDPKIKKSEILDQKTIEPKIKETESKTKPRTSNNWLNKLGDNFKRTSSNIKKAIFSKKIDQSSLEEIEEAFLFLSQSNPIIANQLWLKLAMEVEKRSEAYVKRYLSTSMVIAAILFDRQRVLRWAGPLGIKKINALGLTLEAL